MKPSEDIEILHSLKELREAHARQREQIAEMKPKRSTPSRFGEERSMLDASFEPRYN